MTNQPDAAEILAVRSPSLRGLIGWAVALSVALIVIVVACSFIGQSGMNWDIWLLRMRRIVAAGVVGTALAVSGMALQSLLRNSLADPYVLGISTGAGLGVLIGMILLAQQIGFLWLNTPAMAIVGGLITMAAVYLIGQRRGRLDPYSLLLTGVIVNAFNGAIMLFIYLYASPFVVTDYIGWSMGRIPESPDDYLLWATALLTLLGWLFMLLQSQAFNVQSLGDDVARSSGINVHGLRFATFAAASLMTAAAVALAGPVGFVGLIVPHICRLILGTDHRRLVIASGFLGAAFLVVADTFCRSTVLTFRLELPVGVITAFCGGPFFLYLLRRRIAEGLE